MASIIAQTSPAQTLTLRKEHLITPGGHVLDRWFIHDGATLVAEVRNNGPATEAIARKLAASLDLLAALKEVTPSVPPSVAGCHLGLTTQEDCGHCSRILRAHAAIAKAAEGR